LACVFVVELILGAAVPVVAAHDRRAGSAQLATLDDGATSMVVGDRIVRLVSLNGPGTGPLLSRVAANIGAAIDEVTAFWGISWSRDISVVATGSDEQFRAAAGGGPASQWVDIAAVTVVDRIDPVRRMVAGQRIVLAPGAANMSESALRIVLTHELFHYAARVDTAQDAPRWLTEGVADFVARPITPVPSDVVSRARVLPLDAELDAPGPQRSFAYDRAWWFARFVADTYGPAKLRELYVAACGVGHADLLTAAHDVLGTDSPRLLARWQQWLVR